MPLLREPSQAEVRIWAEGLSMEALRCRVLPSGHQPIETTVDQAVLASPRRRVYIQYYRCRSGCGCEWSQVVDIETGQQHDLRIRYPPGQQYLAPGIGRITGWKRDLARLVYFQRKFREQGVHSA